MVHMHSRTALALLLVPIILLASGAPLMLNAADIGNPDSYSDQSNSASGYYVGSTQPQSSGKGLNPADLDRFTIKIFPEAPQPGQELRATVEGFATNLGRANITWVVEGRTVADGPNIRSIPLTMGGTGTSISVKAYILNETGRVFIAERTLRPTTVDLVWEANTYTPPFFKGKALQSANSLIRLTAFPVFVDSSGYTLDPGQLVYTWIQGTRTMPKISGKGQRTVTITNTEVLGALDITVRVTSPDGSFVGIGKAKIPVAQPEVIFYEDHPLLGVRYDHALGKEAVLAGTEESVVAEPYYFSGYQKGSDVLKYSWLVNGVANTGLGADSSSAVVLKGSADGGKSLARIDLRVRHKTLFMQSARQTLSVTSGGTE